MRRYGSDLSAVPAAAVVAAVVLLLTSPPVLVGATQDEGGGDTDIPVAAVSVVQIPEEEPEAGDGAVTQEWTVPEVQLEPTVVYDGPDYISVAKEPADPLATLAISATPGLIECPCPEPAPAGAFYLAEDCDAVEPSFGDCLRDGAAVALPAAISANTPGGNQVECPCPEPAPPGAVYLAEDCETSQPSFGDCLRDGAVALAISSNIPGGNEVECPCPEPSPPGAVYLADDCEDGPSGDDCLYDGTFDFDVRASKPAGGMFLGDYMKCDCPGPNRDGLFYYAKNCEMDKPREDECVVHVTVDFFDSVRPLESLTVEPSEPEEEEGEEGCHDPDLDPHVFSSEQYPNFVECPCPDNRLRCEHGFPEEFYFTELDVAGGEKCPEIVTDTELCPPLVISMVSANPPVMCPCPDNPDGLMTGEWYQGLGGCDDGPSPNECLSSISPPPVIETPPLVEEVDCECPFRDDEGNVVWYEIEFSHLVRDDVDGDLVCPDFPPDGEGLECPPDPKYLGPPLVDEGTTTTTTTKGKGPKPDRGPPGGPPGKTGGPPPGKAVAAKQTSSEQEDQEQNQEQQLHDDDACSEAPKGKAYGICDKYCNEVGCPDVLGLRRRARRRLLRASAQFGNDTTRERPRRRRTKSATEECELLERRYKEITLMTLEC